MKVNELSSHDWTKYYYYNNNSCTKENRYSVAIHAKYYTEVLNSKEALTYKKTSVYDWL